MAEELSNRDSSFITGPCYGSVSFWHYECVIITRNHRNASVTKQCKIEVKVQISLYIGSSLDTVVDVENYLKS